MTSEQRLTEGQEVYNAASGGIYTQEQRMNCPM